MLLEANEPNRGKRDKRSIPPPKPKEIVSLSAMARVALEACGNSVPRAVEMLTADLMADPVMLQKSLVEIVSTAAAQLVSHDIHEQRRAIQTGATRPNISGKVVTDSMAESAIRSYYLDWPLAGGIRLRHATRDLIEKQRDVHAGIVRENAWRARWFAAIALAMPDHGTVGEVLTEDQVRAFFEASRHD